MSQKIILTLLAMHEDVIAYSHPDNTCDINMKRQMRKFYADINILSRRCSLDVKCLLFKSLCSNMYNTTVWCNCTVTAMRKLKISYNNSLLRLLNIPKHNSASEMFVNLNFKSFGELIKISIHSFMNKLQCSKHLLLFSICKCTISVYSTI